MSYTNHPSALHERIWNAIVTPPCTRCQARADWHPTDCDKHDCHKLYAQEAAAVLDIVFEQRVQGFSDAMDRVIRGAETFANDNTHPPTVRLFALDVVNEAKARKQELLSHYETELEEWNVHKKGWQPVVNPLPLPVACAMGEAEQGGQKVKRKPQERWWDKTHAAITIGVTVILTTGYLQGRIFEKWEYTIFGYLLGTIVTYFLLRWFAIRREKKWLAEMEEMDKECQEEDEIREAKRQRLLQEIDALREDIIRLFSSPRPPLQ